MTSSAALRADKFPVDGFVLDLQWFGGISPGSDQQQMGSRVAWDLTHFPDPADEARRLPGNEGIGIMAIEESYMARAPARANARPGEAADGQNVLATRRRAAAPVRRCT